MHGLSRLGTGGSRSVSSSPPASPRLRYGRSKSFGSRGGGAKQATTADKIVFAFISAVFRRKGVLLFAPLLYISAMLLYMGSMGFDVVNLKNAIVVVHKRPPPGSVYRSPQVFEKLWPFMGDENNGSSASTLMPVWNLKKHRSWKPCINKITSKTGLSELPKSNGFLIIEANGGLNQQRLSKKRVLCGAIYVPNGSADRGRRDKKIAAVILICDAVAVAWLLNATLVIPIFHLNSVWRDSSKFRDIFDEDFFIDTLKNNVNIVKELPEDVLQSFDYNISSIVNLRVKAWSSQAHYIQKVLPKLQELRAVRIAPFSNRLAHSASSSIQGIRCSANFEALRFSDPIRVLADKMVDRMVKNSSHNMGIYVSVHLRFELDMVAFSCCEYDGGEEERREMDIARERGWRGKFRRRGRVIRPGANRMDGKCPLTPLEVGMMLRGMGFDSSTPVYVAAGDIYKEEKYMAPLRQMFPRLETKYTLATPEELAQFKGHSSRLAALDYTVCLHSEVFVTTQGGNFPHFLMGHRRYLYGGHAKTIKPDKRKLALLFENPNISWETFKKQLRDMLRHSDMKGCETKKSSGSLYTFPMPDCMCKHSEPAEKRNDDERKLR